MRIGVYGGRTNRELITRRLFGTYKRECEDGCTSLCTYTVLEVAVRLLVRFFFPAVFFSPPLLPPSPPLTSSFGTLASKFVVQCSGNYYVGFSGIHLYSLVSFYFFFIYCQSWNLFIFLESNEVIVLCSVWLIRN